MNDIDNQYSTSNLHLAATICLSFPLDHIDRNNPQRCHFVFKRERELDTHLEAYWRKELRIEPQAYSEQLRHLKTRLYENT